jgi:RNA-directed DNA polymerase
MGKYLEKAASPEVLNHAWRLLKKDRGLWVKGLPVAEMERNLIKHVGVLSRQLLNNSYRPAPMRCFEVAKADGGRRTLCASPVRDKLAQRAVLTVLEPLGEAMFHEASFGYRPHCTPDMALARVRKRVRRGDCWLGDADIKHCFDAIPQRAALRRLKSLCRDRHVVRLVERWIDAMPVEFLPYGRGRGLPQGMVLSPFLCNLYLHPLDITLEKQGIPFVRFADDFLLCLATERKAARALKVAESCLKKLGLELHPEKTRVIRSHPRHRFLGKRLPDSRERFKA